MKNIVICAVLLLLSHNSNAGTITGYVIGASGKPKVSSHNIPLSVVSDAHDIISCATHDGLRCYTQDGHKTPQEFMKSAGYVIMHTRFSTFSGDRHFITLEVSK